MKNNFFSEWRNDNEIIIIVRQSILIGTHTQTHEQWTYTQSVGDELTYGNDSAVKYWNSILGVLKIENSFDFEILS